MINRIMETHYPRHHRDHHPMDAATEGQLPPGFRFHPTDEELITYYLVKKVLDSSFTGRAITEVDLNKCEPWELPRKAKMGEKEWYFFSLRDRKYPTGLRTNRATLAGYWKATGKDREIYSSRTAALVGMKKTLVFYKGRAPKGEKSNWVMHEYRLEGKFGYHYLSRSSKDEWVISRVFRKSATSGYGALAVGGGAEKKSQMSPSVNFYAEASSPSSASLPPLMDSSPYGGSFDGDSAGREHVSCFSTVAGPAAGFNPHSQQPSFDLDPTLGLRGDRSTFPSLRSLQENLQLPYFFPSPAQLSSAAPESGFISAGNWASAAAENQRVTDNGVRLGVVPSELDCMWTY